MRAGFADLEFSPKYVADNWNQGERPRFVVQQIADLVTVRFHSFPAPNPLSVYPCFVLGGS